ncbi:DUF3916 domain-containing protein [Gottfriedia solisilvae]|uniref:DUF3916 domain-containing protein n=1 Tax=Gottfriedia solisilvae TaxID=1516104 RepID=A0A8J3EWG1_9BACI|nr:DUF3916 domain-containing protein [Gottfriedia solisilvae]GGI11691.1 hypothetical protein GCM10007380_09110 [Gottfriedia solisilvae]
MRRNNKYDYSDKKKIRGLKRRFRNLNRYILEREEVLPIPPNDSSTYRGYRSYVFDFGRDFPGFHRYPERIKKRVYQSLIDFTYNLNQLKGDSEKEYRIFCCLTTPDIDYAAVSILFTRSGMESFYDGLLGRRNLNPDQYQLTTNREVLCHELDVWIPNELDVKGIIREDEDGELQGKQIWLIGSFEE